jgi:quercetin dioxygenase-like cupin family protein
MAHEITKNIEVDGKQDSPWPASLDALVAAPDHHKLLMENDQVRVLDTLILVGEITRVHTHRWPGALYVLSWGDYVRRDGEGNVTTDTRKGDRQAEPPTVIWLDALPPHSLENVGNTDIHLISVELKS